MSERDKWDAMNAPGSGGSDSGPWKKVTIRVPEGDIEQLDALADDGVYPSRSEAIREGIDTVLNRVGIADGSGVSSGGLRPKRKEQLRDTVPHPDDIVGVVSSGYRLIEKGRWRFTAHDGWHDGVLNRLFMEGYRVWRVQTADRPNYVKIDIVEDRWLETGVCPHCGERNEPDFTGEEVTCPDCGVSL